MANKAVPVILMVSGIGITALGGALLWYQSHREKLAAQAQAKSQQAPPPSQPGGGKIPLTVFADEGVPLEAARP